ncbi:MAG: DUF1553 domain-containing protein [Planctomycetota bacterium]|nr:DUF1553 domain-containing protein [Planctomycetota bacterium]
MVRMRHNSSALLGTGALCAAVLSGLLAAGSGLGGDTPSGKLDYVREVRPILARNCFACHGLDEGAREADLRLDLREHAVKDLGGYRAVAPGDSGDSELVLRITDEIDPMPPEESGRNLSEEEVAVLRRWIDEGAEYTPHWAFAAPAPTPPPRVARPDWIRNPIDAFVLARLEAEGLDPAPVADRYTLIRRLALDLTGLPPTPDEARAFAEDPSPDAYERLVDRLLDSPAYGERWARVWLDLARYADSKGHGSDPLRTIWRYRDWVIAAFNDNMPYDRFTIEQLAGDLLPDATVEQRLATAFHRNTMTNTEGGTDDEEFRVAAVKDRAITTAQVWMGLTLGCAECHSHKFDPLSHEEFYGFYAFFNQTADNDANDDRPLLETPTVDELGERERLAAHVAELEGELASPTHDATAALAAWEDEQRARESRWEVLDIQDARSEGGAILTVREDGSISASGPSPDTDVYTIRATSELTDITAVRLEVLADPALPRGGPGRSVDNGNFVLNHLELTSAPPAEQARERVRGRFVRFENPGGNKILSLAEVEVQSAGTNVAPQGAASQSSTAYDGPAHLAVDGVRDGHFFKARSVTHTATESDPWWELDLGRAVEIDGLGVWNRSDGAEGRLVGVTIQILDEQRRTQWSTTIDRAPRPDLAIDLETFVTSVPLVDASADFSQDGWGVGRAIDADESGKLGWAIGPEQGIGHVAAFETPHGVSGPNLTFTLHQEYGTQHTLGRLRLSVTDQPAPVRALPLAVTRALAIPADERDEEARDRLAEHYRGIDPLLESVRDELSQARGELEAAPLTKTPVMVELAESKRRETRVMVKGNFLLPGDRVEAHVPAALNPWPADQSADRLGLARWMVDGANPLTARVAVNRWWAALFGAGLVETEEDFGTQGALPSHPALLDWLAVTYVDGGWDTKALLKTIVTSATYRQASRTDGSRRTRDPANRLHSRGPRFRLEAETVRDVALASSGLLSRKLYGPSVFPPQPAGLWKAAFNGERNWQESTGEDRYRRGVYVFLRRTVPYPSMAVFDAPSREACTPRRLRTNTPLQAFVTLNDPVFVEAAQALARRIVSEAGEGVHERIEHGLWLCLTRPPDPRQVEVLTGLFESERAHFSGKPEAALALATDPLGPLPEGERAEELAAWTVVANVMLNQDGVLVKP